MIGQTDNIHTDLLDILRKLEAHMGMTLTITSGHRDLAHNVAVGGVEHSEHTYDPAEGVDVLCRQSAMRFKMVEWLLANGVKRIGIGNSFLHIGIAKDKPSFVMWDYYVSAEV